MLWYRAETAYDPRRMTGPRYALYYAPRQDEALAAFGRTWLGRDVERGVDVERPAVDGLAAEDLAAVTAEPRHYGFHGT